MLLVDCNFRGVRKTQYPDGVHFCEQIGVTEDEFKDALGRKWLTSTEFPFSTLKSRKVGYARFATVDLINPIRIMEARLRALQQIPV
jgi:hypothetical protein